ncbi:hypothetical protein BOW53_12545 [Solemya pervernicosa gill symbiont]|uniref:AB hydrolase-1 domain-containing protein n=2 Tax=Gammaproteobacteria incertae sedis TaxID=118884 RepID=A0A1T2L268_9GAMM|nr:alpha/beta fold hydrolase [Candidatus Reidiella endopervernicosa]OOZ39208.1 hypothetical protein BOW53_12545 [Solemya pervernicosa gill symbiont]QKQ28048.1 alpha/beta fold hydrolase [Candidatus Reidiella endopervernicosa]
MRRKIIALLLLITPVTGFSAETPAAAAEPPSFETDSAKEQRWAEQIKESLLDGEAVELTAGSQKFFAIYTEEHLGAQLGGVVILHGMGTHPDWPEMIQPLRTTLPEQGWSTLSIQLPVRPNNAARKEYASLFDDAGNRIAAAIAFLQSKGIKNISLIGHSLGAAMAADYIARNKPKAIKGFVGIGMGENRKIDPRFDTPALLEHIDIPILDIYGSHDQKNVLRSVTARRLAAHRNAQVLKKSRRTSSFELSPIVASRDGSRKSGMVTYRQIEIAGADHFFSGLETHLIKRIHGWLERHTTNKNRYITVE